MTGLRRWSPQLSLTRLTRCRRHPRCARPQAWDQFHLCSYPCLELGEHTETPACHVLSSSLVLVTDSCCCSPLWCRPLGPFVGAPPDITARVLREHNIRPPPPAVFDAYDAPPHFDVPPADVLPPEAIEAEPRTRSPPVSNRGVSSRLSGRLGKPNRGGDGYGAYGARGGHLPVFGAVPVDPRGMRR